MVDVVGILARHARHSLYSEDLIPSFPDSRKEWEDDKRYREQTSADRLIKERQHVTVRDDERGAGSPPPDGR